jgi:two-component system chemotaxis response regulator CheB
VLTLDVEMPRMDGISFLRQLMRLHPMPVVMVSSLTEEGAETTLEALSAGAIDFVNKPKVDVASTLKDYAEEIVSKIKSAAAAKVRVRNTLPVTKINTVSVEGDEYKSLDEKYTATVILQRPAQLRTLKTTEKIVAIGASTGGTEAIKEVLSQMRPDNPAIVITQHIPPVFSSAFARRMNQHSAMTVVEAENGQQILPGHAYIAPGDKHLLIVRDGARYRCQLNDGPPVNRHKPSVDVLFRSVAQSAGKNAIGVILTGMGADGARGLKEMREAGAITIAQDEKSSVVWGMPGEAVKLDAAQKVLALDQIPAGIISALAELRN